MYEVGRVCRRPLLIVCVAGLAIAGAYSGVALAGSAYTVTVKVVPNRLPVGGLSKVTASGTSANLSRLEVFLNKAVPCRPTAAGDAAIGSDLLLIKASVVNAYTKTHSFKGVNAGNHFACAYLISVPPPTPTLLRASASAPYVVG